MFPAFIRYSGVAAVLAVFILSSLLLTAEKANAFSLGRIRVTGALNVQFKAEIPVRTDGREGLSVSLGTEADYRKLAIKRPDFLDKLAIQVADHPLAPNQKIIYITSPEPIYQPSFNLLVKASLGGGTIMENYFLAIDFQKNLSLELPKEEEKKEIERVAREMAAIKSAAAKEEEDEKAAIARIKAEEEAAVRREQGIQSMIREEQAPQPGQPAPAPEAAPVATEKETAPRPAPERMAEAAPAPAAEKAAPRTPPAEKKPAPPVPAPSSALVIPAGGVAPVSSVPSENVRVVSKGDTLYGIVKELGVRKSDLDRAVVALWKDNPNLFIGGNIHGLRRGASLNFARINETVKSITSEEAKSVISGQWSEWTAARAAPGPVRVGEEKPLVEVKVPVARLPYRDAVLAALAGWKKTSEAKNSGLEFDLENAELKKDGDIVEATIGRKTKSAEGVNETPQTVRLAKKGDGYEVIEEAGKEPERAEEKEEISGKSFVAHVASYKTRESAERLVELLRKKGFNAYEAKSYSGGKGGWFRVLVDRFDTMDEAANFALNIRKTGISRYTRILRLPCAIKVGGDVDEKEAARAVADLKRMGFSAYTSPAEDGKTSVLVGAFVDKNEAGETAAKLVQAGFSLDIVTP